MFKHYLTTAWRSFRSSPYIATVNVVGLALGLACFIAAYSTVTYFRSGDRHFDNADRIHAIAQRQVSAEGGLDTGMNPRTTLMIANYIRADIPDLDAVVRAVRLPAVAAAADGRAAFVKAAAAEADFLRLFNFEFSAGGGIDALRSPRSAVLTKDTAMRLLGTADAVGKTLLLSDAIDVTVTGVVQELRQPSHIGTAATSALGFEMLVSWDTYIELSKRISGRDPERIPEFEAWGQAPYLTYIMLPKDGSISVAAVNDRLSGFSQRYVPPERAKIQTYEFQTLSLSDLWLSSIDGGLLGGRGMSVVSLLTLLSGLILFTACVNHANLTTTQLATRAREIGMRKITGAKGFDIGAQCTIEVALSATAALLLALLLVLCVAPWVQSAAGIDLIAPLLSEWRLWVAIASVLAAVVLIAGSYPVIVAARMRPAHAIRGGRVRTSNSIVTKLFAGVQFGAASLLLIAVIVVYAQQREMREQALGTETAPVVAIHNNLKASNITFETLRRELLTSPYIESVAGIDSQPWTGVNAFALTRTQNKADTIVSPLLYAVTNDFFSTLDISLLAGRALDDGYGDDVFPGTIPAAMPALGADKTRGVVIDRRLASQLGWIRAEDAIGQRVYIPLSRIGQTDQELRIVGVVEHRPLSLTTPSATANMFYLVPDAAGFQEVLVRIDPAHVSDAISAIDSVWRSLSPNIPIARQFVDEMFEQNYARFSRVNAMIVALAIIAVIVSMLGLFGMALFVAARRRHEIGVRKTVGATTRQVAVLLLQDFSKPVLMANVLVWPLAYFAMQAYLSTFVHRIDVSLLPFLGSLVIALLIAWLTVGVQTIRAARLNPATVLRYE
jgi:putative ABC transport system permease protein